MGRLGFLFDQTRCIGCNACQMACKDAHDLERGLVFRRVKTIEYEHDGKYIVENYSGACNHCRNAACISVCPTKAMHYNEDGTVGHDDSKCIGCGSCTWACPYGAPKLSYKKGYAQKCDSCIDRRQQGHDPYCVEACINHCLQFGDIDVLTRDNPDRFVSTLDYLPSDTITDPSLRIKRRKKDE